MSATETKKAFAVAKSEGLSFFKARMHVGHSVKFVAQSWEDGGFHVNDEGEPRRDPQGNTVATFSVEELDQANSEHVSQCEKWFNG